jgi:hypothetical protein
MNFNYITLKNDNNYWLYILNSNSINDFLNYDKPYFTLPNFENIKPEDLKTEI